MNTVFCFGATSYSSHNKNRKVLIMRLLKVFFGKSENLDTPKKPIFGEMKIFWGDIFAELRLAP